MQTAFAGKTDAELENSIWLKGIQRIYRRERGWKFSAVYDAGKADAELENSIWLKGIQRIYRREYGWKFLCRI